MNVYDFDKTIFHKDSTVEFMKYCFKHYPKTRKYVFGMAWAGILRGVKQIDKTEMKERLYRFFIEIDDMDQAISTFWDLHMHEMHAWYLAQHQKSDVIISASPTFLVQEACKRMGITKVMGSIVDPKTGKTTGLNCHGEEKVRRFRQSEYYGEIDEFYSDSRCDTPLALLAKQSYLVIGEKYVPW